MPLGFELLLLKFTFPELTVILGVGPQPVVAHPEVPEVASAVPSKSSKN